MVRGWTSQEDLVLSKTTNAPAPELEGEQMLNVDEFAFIGLDHGQKALFWDFKQHRYVRVAKLVKPVFAALGTVVSAGAIVHGFGIFMLTGGLS